MRQRRNLNTILNRHWLIRWAARFLQQLRREFPLAPTAREAGVACGSAVRHWAYRRASRPAVGPLPAENQTLDQPCGRGLPASGSPQVSVPSPVSVQLAVWRQLLGLHNKEHARDHNPLTSANPLFSPRGEAKCVRSPSVGSARRPDVARAFLRAVSPFLATSPRRATVSTPSKCNEEMAGLSRDSAVRC